MSSTEEVLKWFIFLLDTCTNLGFRCGTVAFPVPHMFIFQTEAAALTNLHELPD